MSLCRRGLHDLDDPANIYRKPSDGIRRCLPCKRQQKVDQYASDPLFREHQLAIDQERHRELKLEALDAYGGPVCVECGETDVDLLTIDHVNGGGGRHRARLGIGAGSAFHRAMKEHGWPNDPPLQVLCRTCNRAKATAGS